MTPGGRKPRGRAPRQALLPRVEARRAPGRPRPPSRRCSCSARAPRRRARSSACREAQPRPRRRSAQPPRSEESVSPSSTISSSSTPTENAVDSPKCASITAESLSAISRRGARGNHEAPRVSAPAAARARAVWSATPGEGRLPTKLDVDCSSFAVAEEFDRDGVARPVREMISRSRSVW